MHLCAVGCSTQMNCFNRHHPDRVQTGRRSYIRKIKGFVSKCWNCTYAFKKKDCALTTCLAWWLIGGKPSDMSSFDPDVSEFKYVTYFFGKFTVQWKTI